MKHRLSSALALAHARNQCWILGTRSPMKLTEVAAPDFDLAMTLDSGQVFHWEKIEHGFCGAIGDRPVYVEQCGDSLRATNGCADLVRNYFALDHPLAKICALFANDALMQAARDFYRRVRI